MSSRKTSCIPFVANDHFSLLYCGMIVNKSQNVSNIMLLTYLSRFLTYLILEMYFQMAKRQIFYFIVSCDLNPKFHLLYPKLSKIISGRSKKHRQRCFGWIKIHCLQKLFSCTELNYPNSQLAVKGA